MNFGETMKILRIENSLTQDELAEKLKISKSAISMYENGNRKPDYETLELIADYFNVDMDFLLGRSTVRHIPQTDYYGLYGIIEAYSQKMLKLNDEQRLLIYNMIDEMLKRRDD